MSCKKKIRKLEKRVTALEQKERERNVNAGLGGTKDAFAKAFRGYQFKSHSALQEAISQNEKNMEEQTIEVCKKLKDFKTRELVEELKRREGVIFEVAEPYEKKEINIEGPAVMLIVID